MVMVPAETLNMLEREAEDRAAAYRARILTAENETNHWKAENERLRAEVSKARQEGYVAAINTVRDACRQFDKELTDLAAECGQQFGGYADDYKHPTKIKNYGDERSAVVKARDELPLDGVKYATGDFHDLV